mmetsp:Transcript_32956/g.53027  ORF Transcript_32956/g.53027 Transcript_32956/m.53027 type:complete len:345 (-) Transcript_32956:1406-2440(-)
MNQVAQAHGGGHDEEQTNHIHHVTQDSNGSKAQGIAQDQPESSLRRCAEVLSHECDLNICILVEEFHALLEAPDAAAQAPQDQGHHLVLLCLCLLLEVIHQVPDKFDHSDDERSKCQGSQVVAEHVPTGALDGRILALLCVGREEPHPNRTSNDALTHGNIQGVIPKEDKEGDCKAIVENITRGCTFPASHLVILQSLTIAFVFIDESCRPFVGAGARFIGGSVSFRIGCIGCGGGVVGWHLRDEKAHGNAPKQNPQDAHECLNDRHSDDAKGMRHEGGGHLVHSDRQLNATEEAEDHQDVDAGQGPDHIAADFQDFPDIFAGHRVAGGTNRLDDPHRCAFFPP